MDFSLRLLIDEDISALQRVYDACPDQFRHLIGQPADPEQAARDFVEGLQTSGRYQFGIMVDETVVGMVDCKLDETVEGQAHIGLILTAPPYDDPEIAHLALRILTRWLVSSFGVHRLETSVPAHFSEAIGFWKSAGFAFTGEQYRRELPGYNPRFLVLAKELSPTP